MIWDCNPLTDPIRVFLTPTNNIFPQMPLFPPAISPMVQRVVSGDVDFDSGCSFVGCTSSSSLSLSPAIMTGNDKKRASSVMAVSALTAANQPRSDNGALVLTSSLNTTSKENDSLFANDLISPMPPLPPPPESSYTITEQDKRNIEINVQSMIRAQYPYCFDSTLSNYHFDTSTSNHTTTEHHVNAEIGFGTDVTNDDNLAAAVGDGVMTQRSLRTVSFVDFSLSSNIFILNLSPITKHHNHAIETHIESKEGHY